MFVLKAGFYSRQISIVCCDVWPNASTQCRTPNYKLPRQLAKSREGPTIRLTVRDSNGFENTGRVAITVTAVLPIRNKPAYGLANFNMPDNFVQFNRSFVF
jgi:hypothetical protein